MIRSCNKEKDQPYPTTITLDEEQTIALLGWLDGHRAFDIKDGLEDLGMLTPLLRLLDFQSSPTMEDKK